MVLLMLSQNLPKLVGNAYGLLLLLLFIFLMLPPLPPIVYTLIFYIISNPSSLWDPLGYLLLFCVELRRDLPLFPVTPIVAANTWFGIASFFPLSWGGWGVIIY